MEIQAALDKPRRLRRIATRLSLRILKIKLALRGVDYKRKIHLQAGPKVLSEECASSQADSGSQSHGVESTSIQVDSQSEATYTELATPENKHEVFTLFGNLPTEIRLLIWKFALPGPRIVQLRQRALKPSPFILSGIVHSDWAVSETERRPCPSEDSDGTAEMQAPQSTLNPEDQRELDFAWRTNLLNMAGFTSSAKAPAILFVCHESHEVAMQRYTKAFGAHCALPTTWFDYRNDTLLLSTSSTTEKYLYNVSQHNFLEEMLPRIFSAERALVQNLIVDLHDAEDFDYTAAMWLGWIIVMFPRVRSVVYELPGFKTSRLRLDDEGWESFRRQEFEIAFADYRENGTLRYDVREWKDYLAKEHGCRDLFLEETDLGKFLEGLET